MSDFPLFKYPRPPQFFDMSEADPTIDIVRIAYEVRGPDYHLKLKWAKDNVTALVLSGEGEFIHCGHPQGSRSWKLSAGCVFLRGQDGPFEIISKSAPPLELLLISYEGTLQEKLVENFMGWQTGVMSLSRPEEIQALLSDAFEVAEERQENSREYCRHALHQVLIKLSHEQERANKDFQRRQGTVQRCRIYMDRNFRSLKSVQEVAQANGVSPEHLSRQFKKELKLSPLEYLTELKIRMAEELLVTPRITLQEVSEELGFCDAYHFSKTYKRKRGVSPSEFRRLRIG